MVVLCALPRFVLGSKDIRASCASGLSVGMHTRTSSVVHFRLTILLSLLLSCSLPRRRDLTYVVYGGWLTNKLLIGKEREGLKCACVDDTVAPPLTFTFRQRQHRNYHGARRCSRRVSRTTVPQSTAAEMEQMRNQSLTFLLRRCRVAVRR